MPELTRRLLDIAEAFCKESDERWELKRPIDEGNSAAVYLIANEHQKAALKIYDPQFLEGKESSITKYRIREQNKLRDHDCPFLVSFSGAGFYKDTAYILMEYLPWPDLSKQISSIEPDEIQAIIKQVASASRYLIERGICHRDIKPANIALSADHRNAKLLDLGVLRRVDSETGAGSDNDGRRPFLGTLQYGSPEYVIRREPSGERLWLGLTFYQLGAVLHDMIMGKPIFLEHKDTGNRHILAQAVLEQRPLVRSDEVDDDLVLLARDCLEKDLDRRLSLVTWGRFDGDSIDELQASRRRLRLRLGKDRRAAKDGAALERHKQRVLEVAKCLRETVVRVMRDEGYPRIWKDVKPVDHRRAMVSIKFTPPSELRLSKDVEFVFNVESELGGENVNVCVDAGEAGLGEIPVGSISFEDMDADANLLCARISDILVAVYQGYIDRSEDN